MRNHILSYKRQIEERWTSGDYPEIYHRDTPPEVPNDYMARADEIREDARATLEAYRKDEDYRFLLTWEGCLDKKQESGNHLIHTLSSVSGLEKAIDEDDLVFMRRHEYPDQYGRFTHDCAEHIRALPPVENEQISFGMYMTPY